MYGRYHPVPPNGLQLTLTREVNGTVVDQKDTLVMQNLGYFQLQANPGLWKLNLAAGRARDLYMIDGGDGDFGGKLVAVKSFADIVNRLQVAKRPGMENIPLLQDASGDDDDASEGGLWDSLNSLTSFFGSSSSAKKDRTKTKALKVDPDDDGRIHVFSLATGHMYERLLRIMMLSVSKRTSMPVKVPLPRKRMILSICDVFLVALSVQFWLLENFLSPTFKEVAALMAATYGFEVLKSNLALHCHLEGKY